MALFDYPPITWNPLGAPSQVNIPMFAPSSPPTLFPPAQPVSLPSEPSMIPRRPLPEDMETGYSPSYDPNEAGITTDPAQFALSTLGVMNPALAAIGTIGTMGALNVNPETPGFLGGLSTAFGEPDLGYGEAMGLGGYGPESVESVEESAAYGDAMGLGDYGPDEATEASAAYGDAFGLEGYADDSDSDAGGDDTVICTAFYDAGIVSRETHRRTSLEGARMGPEVIRGYHVWGKPVARVIRRYPWVRKPAYAILRPYMEQIARGDHGRVVKCGIAVCKALGRWAARSDTCSTNRLVRSSPLGGTGGKGIVEISGRSVDISGLSLGKEAAVEDTQGLRDGWGSDNGHARPSKGEGVQDSRLYRGRSEKVGRHGPGRSGDMGANEWMRTYDPGCETGLEAAA